MEQRRKVTIILLIGLTLFLGVGSILVTQIIRTNQSPTDSAASGFGEEATKDLYSVVEEAFLNSECEFFLNKENLILDIPSNEGYDLWQNSELGIYDIGSKVQNPINCSYIIENTQTKLGLSIYTYTQYSQIDDSKEDLYARINSSFPEYLGGATYFNTDSFVGYDPEFPNQCLINFFHTQNDFEYAVLYIENFDCSSSRNLPMIDTLEAIFSKQIDQVISSVNNAKENGLDNAQFNFVYTPRTLEEISGETVDSSEVFQN